MDLLKSHKSFDGLTQFWQHASAETRTPMRFSTFVPAGGARGCVVYLAGLTCTEETFITKAGAQRWLADLGLMAVCPDTSPRGLALPGEHESWDFGAGAGFYVDATTPGYRDHYRMDSYVTGELYALIQQYFPVEDRISLMGHSMGGHGALALGLRGGDKFKAVSAFAPVVNPVNCPWGQKAFTGYLGERGDAWNAYDACELVRAGRRHPGPILIDQGADDGFLARELLTENFVQVCRDHGQPLVAETWSGYDHSYFFIASFVERHLRFHARRLFD